MGKKIKKSKNLKLFFLYVPYQFGGEIKLENTFFQNLKSNFRDVERDRRNREEPFSIWTLAFLFLKL